MSDLDSISDVDQPEVRASKERIFGVVKQWLGISTETTQTNEFTDTTEATAV